VEVGEGDPGFGGLPVLTADLLVCFRGGFLGLAVVI
jgi:hypothetical protein